MDHLHTTSAFVLAWYPHGESTRVYKFFTREFGVMYVHAQGVRDIKNRNRYALATHAQVSVTLVRGRGAWRLTGARSECVRGSSAWRRALTLAGRLLPQEDPVPQLFDILHSARWVVGEVKTEEVKTYEAVMALRILHELGYVARPRSSLAEEVLTASEEMQELVVRFHARESDLVGVINAILHDLPRT